MKEIKDKFIKDPNRPKGKGLKFMLVTVGDKVQVWLERHLKFAKFVNAVIHEIFDEDGNTINEEDNDSTEVNDEVHGESRVRKTRTRARKPKRN